MNEHPHELQAAVERAEAIADASAREAARDLAAGILSFHRAALVRLVELLEEAGAPGRAVLARAAADDLVASAFLLHDVRTESKDVGRIEEPRGQDVVPVERLTRRPHGAAGGRCDLCAEPLGDEHDHLFAPSEHRLACACRACGVLFDRREGGRYRKVPARAMRLDRLRIPDPLWEDLGVPVSLAFFFHASSTGGVVAAYPGPAGAAEMPVDDAAWDRLTAANADLGDLEQDVEALLVNRQRGAAAYYRVSIDWCYRLTGAIRASWKGISGGDEVSREVETFFATLEEAVR